MTAFQRLAATVVVPVSTAVQTFLPIVLEPFFLREHWSSASYGGGPIIGGGFAKIPILIRAGGQDPPEPAPGQAQTTTVSA